MADKQSENRFAVKLNQQFKAVLRGPRQALRRVFGSSGPLSDLYYGLLASAFALEHRAVLYGIFKYEQLEQTGEANRFLLRRNIHRLEKGLLMRPRRELFALGYIEETVRAYERCQAVCGCSEGDNEELRWANNVLTEYFRVSSSDSLVDDMNNRFAQLPPVTIPSNARPAQPYLRDLTGPPPVDFDALLKLTRRRSSVRWFRPESVPRELLDKAVTAAIEAPSACNRQPFQFRIFDDPELVGKVANLPMGTKGFAHNFPAIVVLVGQLRAYFHPRDRHIIYIDASLAAMGFMLALETLGLSSCAINWPEIPEKERAMAKLLDLESDERPIMLMAVGYPDPEGEVAFSPKQSIDNLRTYNR
jgi:nitroreductase